MPLGNPKRFTTARLDPDLVAEVRSRTDNLTKAIEEGLEMWIKRQKRLKTARAEVQRELERVSQSLVEDDDAGSDRRRVA